MVSVCHKPDAICDYKEELIEGTLHLCRRYWKTNDQDFEQISTGLIQLPGKRQDIKLNYDLIRLFLNKVAHIRMEVAKGTMRYVNLLSSQFVDRFESWSPTGQQPNWSIKSNTISSDSNHGFKSGMVLKGLDEEHTYQIRLYVTPDASDDDTIGVVFRYDRRTRNYYSLEWNNGGISPKGICIKKNIYNASTGGYTETILYTNTTYLWNPGVQNYITVNVYPASINVQVDDRRMFQNPGYWTGGFYGYKGQWIPSRWEPGTYYTKPLSFSLPLTDNRLLTGTYGVMTYSQTAKFNYFAGHALVEDVVTTIVKPVTIDKVDYVGGNYILSDTMDVEFKEERDKFLADNNMSRDDLLREKYQITSSNVFEPIEFDNRSAIAKDPSSKVSMRTWDYDVPIPYTKLLEIADHVPRTINHSYPIIKDVYVRGVVVEFTKKQYEDKFILDIGGRRIYNDGVTKEHWRTDFEEYINADVLFNIVFHYIVNDNPIAFFWKHEHVDTHDKQFTIKENELGWHHIPSIETEADDYR